jgi:hypothetical protein
MFYITGALLFSIKLFTIDKWYADEHMAFSALPGNLNRFRKMDKSEENSTVKRHFNEC